MDAQLIFLEAWATICQGIIDHYLPELRKFGEDKAHEMFVARSVEYFKAHPAEEDLEDMESFSRAMFACGLMYVELMIQFGVFGGD
jgi:hypothetical protein